MTKREFLDIVFALAPTEANAIMDAFDEYVESNEPHWIPCDKELPKEDGQYIATVKYKHVDGYEDVYSETCGWYNGHFDTTGFSYCGEVEKILAWMPLPEPYKEVTE